MAKFKVGDMVKVRRGLTITMPDDWVGSIGIIVDIGEWSWPYEIKWQGKAPVNADPIESFKEDELEHHNSTLIKQRLGIK